MAKAEVQQLVELLHLRQRSLSGTLGGGFPQLRASLWHSKASVTSAAQALTPQMTENKAKVQTPSEFCARLPASASICWCRTTLLREMLGW